MQKDRIFRSLEVWWLLVAAGAALVSGCGVFVAQEPQGDVLIYEADDGQGGMVDLDKLATAVDRRLNSSGRHFVRIRILDGRRIEVALFRRDDKDTKQVESLLAHRGTLEFRILANKRDNKDFIDRALADPSKVKIMDRGGHVIAWWAPVEADVKTDILRTTDAILREQKRENRTTTEVLVLNDDYNVTGAYVEHAAVDAYKGQPCIHISFNQVGGQLFGGLTSSHLPDKSGNFTYKLGIIVNGALHSAPSIQCTIFDHAQITGNFTEQEVENFVQVLNSGSLPADLRLVEKKKTKP
jgi:SecD/SecF fusion protein